jgi:hypothetical protein
MGGAVGGGRNLGDRLFKKVKMQLSTPYMCYVHSVGDHTGDHSVGDHTGATTCVCLHGNLSIAATDPHPARASPAVVLCPTTPHSTRTRCC